MKKWHKRKYCKKCKGYRTTGGFKILFGAFSIGNWEHECRCFRYSGKTELDKKKCNEVLREQENDNKTTL